MDDIKKGDYVKICGDIRLTKNVVHVTNKMETIINDDKSYEVTNIKYGGRKDALICQVAGWWWSPKNIERARNAQIKIKNCKPSVFNVELLDV